MGTPRLTQALSSTPGYSSNAAGKGGGIANATQQQKEFYSYDPVGNRLSYDSTKSYVYNQANQLEQNGGKYAYDNNGNLVEKVTSEGKTEYGWDFENRLVKISAPEGTVVEFAYDPFGRRILKEAAEAGATTTTRYYYDDQNILFEYDDTGAIGNRYTHGPGVDEHLAVATGKERYYYHADGLGSVMALTDSMGKVVQTSEYDSFGTLKNQKNRVKQTYAYTGREWDKESGLYFYRARYYDPMEGRFISKDPIGFKGGINLYNYVESNPINDTDPSGEKSFKDLYCEKISGVIGVCADLTSIGATLTGAGAPVGITASFISAGNTGLSLYYCSRSKLSLANAATTALGVLSSKYKVFNIIVTDVDAGLTLSGMDLR